MSSGGAYHSISSNVVAPTPHPPNGTTLDDVSGLWDELSHQQSREIQQHEERMASRGILGGGATAAARLVRQTLLGQPPQEGPMTTTTRRAPLADFGFATSSSAIMGEPLLVEENSNMPPPPPPGTQPLQEPPPTAPPLQTSATGPATAPAQEEEEGKNDFVFLRQFPSMPRRRDGWGTVPNLDLFFSSIYNYYYHKGLTPIIGKGLVELVSLFFTLWLSVFLFVYLDWRKLATCKDEDTCHARLSDYILDKPFEKSSLWHFLVVCYCLLVSLYGVFAMGSLVATLRDAREAQFFFQHYLGISSLRLQGGAVEWDQVVAGIVHLQQSGEYRIAIHGHLDALVVAQRILRRENFLVAFFNLELLNLTVPFRPKLLLFSKSIEWSLYFCILSYMFNDKYQIRPAFYLNPSALRRRFVLCGVAHAVFMPFLLFFMTLHFFMLNIYDWRSSKQYLGPRDWSLLAKWKFREFNELPHAFEKRLGPSYEASEQYMKLFTQSATMAWMGRLLVFLSGSLGAVLLALGAVNDSILLHIKIGPWNLLWYVVVLGVAYSAGKGMLPDKERLFGKNWFAEMDAALTKVASHTHYYPESWKGRAWETSTQKAFSSMIGFKAQLFAMEALSTLLAPIVLCVSLPPCADDLCAFVHKIRLDVPGAGEVCGYSTFHFDRYQDDHHWHDKSGAAAATGPAAAAPVASFFPKTRLGKMERSFFHFKAAHPLWKCSASSGQEQLLEEFQTVSQEAMARERQMQLEAAVLALQRWEQVQTSTTPMFLQNYVTRPGGADSGGGGPAISTTEPGDATVAAAAAPGALAGAGSVVGPRTMATSRSNLHPISELSAQVVAAESLAGGVAASSASLGSVPHYADAGVLSTELRQLLNRSTLDPSLAGSLLLGRTLLEQSLFPPPVTASRGGAASSNLSLWGSQEAEPGESLPPTHAAQRREYMRFHPQQQQQQQQQQQNVQDAPEAR